MRIVLQRVRSAWVTWEDGETARIGSGLLCLVGLHRSDNPAVLEPMAAKLLHLRVFEDVGGRLNHSLLEVGGDLVLVPQFTLYADCRKGRRPSFTAALEPEAAHGLFRQFVQVCARHVPAVQAGQFGAHMQVHGVNDGPITILLDSGELGLPRT